MSARIAKVPRAVGRRLRTRFARYQHRLRPPQPPDELIRRALPPEGDPDDLLRAFRTGSAGRFYFDPADAALTAAHLERTEPGWGERTLADADRIVGRVVRLLGADELSVDDLPWHADPLSDYSWDPRTFYREVAVPDGRADIKVPWELSRCQHLPTLGVAYAASGRDRYAEEVVAQIRDWIEHNPPGFGVNWACTMDVAIRCVNWLWAWHLVAEAPAADDEFLTLFLASLVAHARHIERNIEIYEAALTTNHTVADYAGLAQLGLLLPDLREARRWADTGIEGLVGCMRDQVGPDGVDFENSIPYHRLVLEMFLATYVLASRNGRPMPDDYAESLERMLEFVHHYTRPDGLAPLVGDSDDGRLQILSRYFEWNPQDHRYLLAVGAALFGRTDFEAAARHAPGAAEEVAWLVGREAVVPGSGEQDGGPSSRAFAHSGRYVMRHRDHYALVCTDEVGTAGLGNHKHNDILSFELTVDGTAVVVDSGSFLYTSEPEWRNRFRSTRAHSTVVVDGAEQNEAIGPFGMHTNARVTVDDWRSGPRFDVLDASHTGYERLPRPATHRRRICLRKDPFAWLVIDTLIGEGERDVETLLHLAPGGELADGTDQAGAAAELLDSTTAELCHELGVDHAVERRPGAFLYTREGTTVLLVPLNAGPFTSERGWFAPRYGQRVEAPVALLTERVACGRPFGYLVIEG